MTSFWWWLRPRLVVFLLACTVSLILVVHILPRRDQSVWGNFAASVGGLPVTLAGRIQALQDARQGQPRYLFHAVRAGVSGRRAIRLLLTLPPAVPPLWPGDQLTVTGRLLRPPTALNPGGFDYRAYLANQRISALLTVDDPEAVHITARAPWFVPGTLAVKLRATLAQIFRDRLPPVAASILGGFTIGELSDLPTGVEQAFRDAGVFHLLVVSGSNVALVMGLAFGFWRLLLLSRRASLCASLPVIWLYTLMGGGDPPVLRATVMATVGVLAYLLSREATPTHCLALAALVVLLWEPGALFDASFQLSFMATLGIVWAVPRWNRSFPSSRRLPMLRWIWPLLIASLSAQVAVAPVVIWYFHRLSLIGLLANLCVPLLAEVIVMTGITLLAIAWLPWRSLVDAVSWVNAQLVDLLVRCVEGFARVPGAAVTVATPTWWEITLFYGIWLSLVLGLTSRRWRWVGGGLLIVWLTGWAAAQWSPRWGPFKVWILAVGLGDAVVVQFPTGEQWLIDGGGAVGSPDRVGERIMLPALWALGIRRLDTVVLTHPTIPHYGAQRSVVQHLRVGRWLLGSADGKGADYNELLHLIWRRRIPVRIVRLGEAWQVGPVRVEMVVTPSSTVPSDDTTGSPLILTLQYGNCSLLFPSDATANATTHLPQILLRNVRSNTVVLIPHHGTVPLAQSFAQALQGSTAVISSDRPSPIALGQLSGTKDLFLTSRDGAILIESDGQTTSIHPLPGT
ncbi:MAG: DNA internalization-related competence protein ComEC/Rec2 [Elusimicrobia bacterium]|nr:DNA internalization-related competence protein ComEC/Rec2 [Elusimicrobiota bacterium]